MDLIRAVRTVASGNALLDPSGTRRLIEAYGASSTRQSGELVGLPTGGEADEAGRESNLAGVSRAL